MIKKTILIIFSIYSIGFHAQVKWHVAPEVKEVGDTLVYELNCNYFYNYFYQRYDSLTLDLINFTPVKIKQILKVHSKNKEGHLNYSIGNRRIYTFNIRNSVIEGLGFHYNSLLEKSNGSLIEQGQFHNSKLSGNYFYFSHSSGMVLTALLYKNGKIRRVFYNCDGVKNKKRLKLLYSYP